MDETALRSLLEAVASGDTDVATARAQLAGRHDPAFHVDCTRPTRCGMPEVIFCLGKEPQDVARIARTLVDGGSDLMGTRASPACFAAVQELVPDAIYHRKARAFARRRPDAPAATGLVAVITAGTSDLPVAEEARVTLETFGSRVETYYDVGVAGVHRLLAVKNRLDRASALIVVAGMEGALASVVGGLTRRPVIGVPTSVGYGASFGGLAALLGMLNACAASVSVVNIDNGFGAGAIAHLINRQSRDFDSDGVAPKAEG